jgi:ATP-dependent DNA helicase RecG
VVLTRFILGSFWYGRPSPDYTLSNREGVRLILRGGAASLEFAAFVYEQDKAGASLSLDELLILNQLQHERRIDAPTVGRLTQRGETHARAVLERLVDRGLIEPRGERRGRVYHLSAALYRRLGVPSGCVRTHGFDPIRQEAMVVEFVKAHGRITRREAAELCGLSDDQASHLLRRLAVENKLTLRGKGRGAYYEPTQ